MMLPKLTRLDSVFTTCLLACVVSATLLARGSGAPAQDPGSVVVSTVQGTAPQVELLDTQALVVGLSGDVFLYDNRNLISGRILRYQPATGVLSNYAGGGQNCFGCPEVDGGFGAGTVRQGRGIAAAPDGTLYFSQGVYFNIRKVTTAGVISGYAGGYLVRGSNDGPAVDARFSWLGAIAADAAGVLYVTDPENFTVRRISAAGVVTTLAGSAGQRGTTDGTGVEARFNDLAGITVDGNFNVYVGDGERIRCITPDGVVSTLAGVLGAVGTADGESSTAHFTRISSLSFGGGVVYALDGTSGCAVRRVTLSGTVTTPTSRQFTCHHLAAAPDGRVYIVTAGNTQQSNLYMMLPSGAVTWLLNGTNVRFLEPTGIATRSRGVLEGTGDGFYYRFAPNSQNGGVNYPGLFAYARGLSVAPDGTHYLAIGCGVEGGSYSAGDRSGTDCGAIDGTGPGVLFREPTALTMGGDGFLYVADTGNHTIRRVATGGVVTTFAGAGGRVGQSDGPVDAASFNHPGGIVRTSAGVIYVADTDNHTIRRISGGVVTILAGMPGVSGATNGTGSAARFNRPMGLALDRDGTVLVADAGNHIIRRVATDGVVSTVAGQANTAGRTNGTGLEAQFNSPQALAVDDSGTIFVADTRNREIRQIRQSAAVAPVFTAQPVSVTVNRGQTSQFSCQASGTPSPGYQWQSRTGNGNWTDFSRFSGAGDLPLENEIPVAAAVLGQPVRGYRCIATNEAGSVTSDEATLTVTSYDLAASPMVLRFGASRENAGTPWRVTAPQTVSVTYSSPVVPQWTVTPSQSWLQVSRTSGIGADTFTVTATVPDDFTTFRYGTVTLSAPNANLTTVVQVQLNAVTNDAAPFGVLDTPVNGAQNLSGAIVVSGWALDDVGVEKVEIWRDLAPGETTPPYIGPGPGNGKVFVAHGDFIPGTRPDVETLYSHYPSAQRSGWGYVLLTYGFPDRGNGTFTIHAYAYDTKGAWTAIGSKTIGMNNNAATKPFGTIDYPAPGSAISGMFTNNGWVLTPNVNGSPTCAITSVAMTIDSGPQQFPVTYGTSRPDVAAAFPGYSGGDNVGGQVTFDTTQFANGLHTIGWLAYDNCGRGEGIGSRFVYIQNSGADALAFATRDLASIGLALDPLPPRTARAEVLQQTEVELPVIAGATWTGYEVVNGEARRLPIGSTLDATAGRFYWAPAPGFLGTFDLRFVAQVGGVAVAHVPVRVVVGPSVRLVVDSPAPLQNTSMHFTIEGWAADLGAAQGTGIDAVHVWAYPVGGGAPVFAGAAELGVSRPDVAALHGARFGSSGFRLPVTQLPRGLYDLVIYPHSTVDGEFRGARVVRIHVR